MANKPDESLMGMLDQLDAILAKQAGQEDADLVITEQLMDEWDLSEKLTTKKMKQMIKYGLLEPGHKKAKVCMNGRTQRVDAYKRVRP